MNRTIGNAESDSRLESLRKREQALKAAIATEQMKRQKREEKVHARLVCIVGEALIEQARKVPDFELMLRQVLAKAVTDERARQFLTDRGWL